ncbi:conserved protein of unknown function [Rhodovastum atsumiense]|uniref:Rhodanese domain-containing protein n=1 Tax=Rhodovastum atsumiense TaxID=504468 RepID=A0A5M6IVX2_9PROT|nr:rhodanese-like domain-containing protein [Rhodovastum atsumiense]KAA5612089.1 hypothetical protein F1189_11575 [Rhodovastum atsumiense]CAH2604035.1 conserved protein of unknown function [Rhodovastum atsumiense]
MRSIDAATLRGWITDRRELAILDAREEGEYATGHLFWAVPCPLSRMEIRARALLPSLATRIVCVDDGRELAVRLAGWLESLGADDVSVLAGGTPAWQAAGYPLFAGVNLPSRAFAAWVARHDATEVIAAPDLARWLETRHDLVVLDSRSPEEFRRRAIPTAVNVPGGELVYRIADLVPDPDTVVVVTAAAHTRAILGAESLRRAGVPNRVLALRDGLMGWDLAGFALAQGSEARFPPGRPASAALALARAKAFAEQSGVGVIGPLDLARFEEDPGRSCYVLDVRDPAEFAAGHRPGSLSAPGGQLVRATDAWIAVHNARIALIDDDGVRARMAAAWLRRMGHRDVFVVEGGLDEATVRGPGAIGVPELQARVDSIDADALAACGDATVVDLARSVDFREGHIPGALWGLRTRLDLLQDRLMMARLVVLTSPDGMLARLAVPEAQGLTGAPVRVLEGGTAAWSKAALKLERDHGTPSDVACIDVWLSPCDRNAGVAAAMQEFLEQERGLERAAAQDGTVSFGLPVPG